jgi:enoyl-CoA hydratase/carnithine racemase
VLRGELVNAATAAELGVFDEVVPDAELLGRAIAVAGELAELPPVTYGLVKQRLRSEHGRPEMLAGAAAAAEAEMPMKFGERLLSITTSGSVM